VSGPVRIKEWQMLRMKIRALAVSNQTTRCLLSWFPRLKFETWATLVCFSTNKINNKGYTSAGDRAHDFYPYGGEIVVSGSDANHYKFTGKERDTESGLDNFGARYYASSTGRFMTADWAAQPTAVPFANFRDPQTLNLYSNVRNNPLATVDVNGHCFDGISTWACIGAVVAIGVAYELAKAYFHGQEAKSWAVAAQKSGEILTKIPSHAPGTDQVDVDKVNKQHNSELLKATGKAIAAGTNILGAVEHVETTTSVVSGTITATEGTPEGSVNGEAGITTGVDVATKPIGDAAQESLEQQQDQQAEPQQQQQQQEDQQQQVQQQQEQVKDDQLQ
jgi:RHS repeat-associated protein